MRKHDVISTQFETSVWYVNIKNSIHPADKTVFIILRKDFIQSIGKVIRKDNRGTGLLSRLGIIVTTIDGREQKICMSITREASKDRAHQIIYNFEKWYRKKKRKR